VLQGIPSILLKKLNAVSGNANEFLSWNLFKVDCPQIFLDSDTREVDMNPTTYFKNYVFDDLSVSYIESSQLIFRRFFFEWIKMVIDPDTYSRSYYDDVSAGSFKVYPIGFSGKTPSYDEFFDLVPFEINSLNFDVQDDGSQTVLTTVKFKYMKHKVKPLPTN
jgi:hypothetical protein